ncbi:hypothetical protein L210DRAFT_961824 [Boletus edulis BED1]|uniref:DUF6532 domain-containing protein n=1 Tax=Boletus edulis BED1 TaxID=1328754 RepID=A0AAD4GC50_BOLED|nr:hypothetical protein L210DRAFT_961824 [Boletus edulis BED1]
MLKSKAHELVLHFYMLGGDQSMDTNKANAEALIRGSSFMPDGADDEGSTNNMTAPALAALIIEFFYTGPSALGVVFPKVFSPEVPEVTVSAIDEYAVTGTRQDQTFEYAGYSKIFASFYSMQLAINKDTKHVTKTKALRVEWACSTV